MAADQFGRPYIPGGGGESGYSPYSGMGLFGGGYGLGVPVAPPTQMPGYDLSKAGLGQTLAQAQTSAAQGRQQAGRTNTRNLGSINTSAADRGDFFSGDRTNLRGQENQDYQSALASIAQQLAASRAAYTSGLGNLNLQNASYLAQFPSWGQGPMGPGAYGAGGADQAYNPYQTRQPYGQVGRY